MDIPSRDIQVEFTVTGQGIQNTRLRKGVRKKFSSVWSVPRLPVAMGEVLAQDIRTRLLLTVQRRNLR